MNMKDSLVTVTTFFLIVLLLAAWVTHVITCLSDDRWGFLIAGAIFFPTAILHGFAIWLGLV